VGARATYRARDGIYFLCTLNGICSELSQGHVSAPSSRPLLLTLKQCSCIGALLVIYFQRFFHQLKSTFICFVHQLCCTRSPSR
jgi:hypothetical protein